MKQWFRRIKRMMQREPQIPEVVLQQIFFSEEINIVYESKVKDNPYWRYNSVLNDYISHILWNAEDAKNVLRIIAKDEVSKNQNVLIQRVFSGYANGTYYYGTMSFVKFKKSWYYINSSGRIQLTRLPTQEESYAIYQDENDLRCEGKFDKMTELYFTYEDEK